MAFEIRCTTNGTIDLFENNVQCVSNGMRSAMIESFTAPSGVILWVNPKTLLAAQQVVIPIQNSDAAQKAAVRQAGQEYAAGIITLEQLKGRIQQILERS